VDEIEPGEPLDPFSQMASEYLDSFEQEERQRRGPVLYQTPIMRRCWEIGSFWYFHAVNSPKGLYRLFNEHLQPLFCPDHCSMRLFDQITAPYWSVGAAAVIQAKVDEEARYKDRLREAFAAEQPSNGDLLHGEDPKPHIE
jgi:hypothetical protein